ncbi:MAG: C_GCAxxG_C_C family protein [Spirochaetales bacterium]|nr:C_GCAxxG_C_C family protein [Spirochaetales bacterium]
METINGYTRQKAMEKAFQLGFEGESKHLSCSQCSFNAIMEVLGRKNDQLFRCLGPLEGGGAVTAANSCGAFSGSLAAIGYFFGRTYEQFEKFESSMEASLIGQELYARFKERYGTAICRDILKGILGFETDFMDEAQFKRFEEAGGHASVCPSIVGLAAAWTIDILWDRIPKDRDLSDIPTLQEADRLLAPH